MKKTIRLTESDLNRIIRRVINEQIGGHEAGPAPIPGQCLRKSGFTRESIGGPMTRRLVYEKTHNNITYQIDITGNDTPSESVRIIKNNKSQVCSTWVCDSSSPIGIKASDCKPEKVNYM